MAAWLTVDQLREDWPDAPRADSTLQELADAAQLQLERFAPPLADGAPAPANYRRALRLQVRELHAAARREGDVIGTDVYAVRARPLTGTVKALLRPEHGVPVVG